MTALDPEVALAIEHAPPAARDALRLLFVLDARLGAIVRATREPLIGEMRLTWWRDSLDALREEDAPAEPLLRDLASSGLDRNRMAAMAEGWIELLAPFPLHGEALISFAAGRGGALFVAGGQVLGVDLLALTAAGEGWALADFAFHCSDADTARQALSLAKPKLETALAHRWPKAVRPLGMIATLALRDARAGGPPPRRGSPARQFAMLRHRLTGR
jgi:phytoene synthase